MDTTLAISEAGVNTVFHKALAGLPPVAKTESQTWGPFFATYSVAVFLSGGTASLENAPANKLDVSGLHISGSVAASVGFDLGLILPTICIPPEPICADLPLVGHVCLPQFCIPWPHASISPFLPFSFNVDLSFGFRVDDLGAQWGIDVLVDPFSPRFDLTPMAPVILSQMEAEVTSKLSAIPGLGGLLSGLIKTVMDAFTPIVDLLLDAISGLINAVLKTLDLLNVSIPFNLLKFDKLQTFIPTNVPLLGDAPVKMTLTGLTASVLDHELVAEGQFA